jgi:RsmE family RNA methyltransferase
MVEKLAELEVRRLLWLRTRLGSQHFPDSAKTKAWAQAGLEQSDGAWLMNVADHWTEPHELASPLWFADVGADPPISVPDALTVAVGPEGGWASGEIAETATRFGLGRTVLRVETAAIVAAARILS